MAAAELRAIVIGEAMADTWTADFRALADTAGEGVVAVVLVVSRRYQQIRGRTCKLVACCRNERSRLLLTRRLSSWLGKGAHSRHP